MTEHRTSDARHERVRAELQSRGIDAIVLTDPADVLYATGYESVLERWNLQERVAAAIVPADPSRPVMLCIPEANIALLAVMAAQGRPDRAQEIYPFDLLTFCEVSRALDPHARTSHLGEAAMQILKERVRGKCQPEILASIAEALRAHGLLGGRLAFDDLRVGMALARRGHFPPERVVDGLEAIVRARVVKTPEELEAFRRVGRKADACIAFAAEQLAPGVTWTELQCRVADFMMRSDIVPVDEGALLFGGAFRGDFIPELFRTRHDEPLEEGQVVILETLGRSEGYWIDINRTATIGPPKPEYQRLHDTIRDAYLRVIERLRPGVDTGELTRIAYEYIASHGVSAPEKLLLVTHGIGLMPLELPIPYPSYGLAGARGFTLEKDMVVSVDCLYFGSEHGPCHMESVFIIEEDGAVSTYQTPYALLGPR